MGKKMANLRQKGKIPRSEWPNILTRYGKGETIAQIGRDYGCTAPAIRYIVKRSGLLKSAAIRERAGDAGRKQAAGQQRARVGVQVVPSERTPRERSLGAELRQRVSGDVASFLVALDQAVLDGSLESLASLREATDSLMRSAARTRLELERLLTHREAAGAHEYRRPGSAQSSA
jgi:hypothetical protein